MSSTISLQHVIEQVSQEKSIDPRILIEAMEQAILTAARRTFGLERELEARYNEETGSVDLFQYMTVVVDVETADTQLSVEEAESYGLEAEVGEELGFQIFYLPEHRTQARQQDDQYGDLLGLQQTRNGFGRIAAQTAKQVIIQRVRDAERDRIHNEFKSRIGEIITGTVRRFERGSNIIVDLGQGVEAVLPPREQTPRESYRPGDRVMAYLKEIDREARGPQIILSRTNVGLLVKLFEMEVPEIYEGIVKIVAAAREPGARSKIAVSSRDMDVDPVGACVGMKGSRVQAVVQELRGEKIDIVPWDEDPARFVCNAIAPAEVVRVVIDEGNAMMELVVPDAKLSLAIGRRGQNVRLASQLTKWRLDIISESRFREIEDDALRSLGSITDDSELPEQLYRLGFRSLDEIVDASDAELVAIGDLHSDQIGALKDRARAEVEAARQVRLRAVRSMTTTPTEHDRFLLVRGVNGRVAEKLEQSGYNNVEALARETDTTLIATKCGVTPARAVSIHAAAQTFIAEEWPTVLNDLRKSVANAREVARLDAEERKAEEALARAQQPVEGSDVAETSADATDAADVSVEDTEG